MPKVDITHTVSLKNRPHPDARLIRLATGEAVWDIPQDVSVLVAAEVFAVREPETEVNAVEPDPMPEPAKSVAKRVKVQAKRLLHG